MLKVYNRGTKQLDYWNVIWYETAKTLDEGKELTFVKYLLTWTDTVQGSLHKCLFKSASKIGQFSICECTTSLIFILLK